VFQSSNRKPNKPVDGLSRPAAERSLSGETLAGAELPVPNFRGMRLTLWASLLAAVLFPLGYIGVSAYGDWNDRIAAATDITARTTRAAQENALKLFDIDSALLSRFVDVLGGRDAVTIRNDERAIHSMMQRVGGGYPQVAAISVFGDDGKLLATSLYSPTRDVSIADDGGLRAAREDPRSVQISALSQDRVTGQTIFAVSQGLTQPDGQFAGVVSIAMRPSYYQDFYRQLLGNGEPLAIGLVRADSTVLAWYSPSGNGPDGLYAHMLRLDASKNDATAGELTMRVSNHGQRGIVALQRVGSYGAYVLAFYPLSAVRSAWWHRNVIVGAATLLPSIALWIFLVVALRRLRIEETAWRRLVEESRARVALEISQRETQRLETLGNMVGSVAHDFNNLLMAISAHAQIALSKSRIPDKSLLAIARAVANGQRLTRSLLGVARKQPLHEEVLLLPEWAHGFALVRATLGDSISFTCRVEPDTWPVRVDPGELELAILNVAINARDAMAGGGSFLLNVGNVSLPAGKVGHLAGDYVRIAMTDCGPGMDASVAARAFEPFFTTKPVGRGTGLGLPQVRALCERSGGGAALESERGKGTTITLYLPRIVVDAAATRTGAVAPAQVQSHAQSQTESPQVQPPRMDATLPAAATHVRDAQHGGLRVLLVEDDGAVGEAEKALLETFGHTVDWVGDAHQALQRLSRWQAFDVVLSDVQMPGGLSGIDLAQQLQIERPHLPVILLTGYTDELDRLQTLGITALTKPFDIRTLHERLAALCRV
jgi:signal transduction histidine kinase